MGHRRLLLFPLLLIALAACVHAPAAGPRPLTLLVSIDGFRADYLNRGKTPALRRLAEEGAWAPDGMRPSFPSLTYPNHYALVTGKRPDRSGIVANVIEDPVIPDTVFTLADRATVRDRRWWDQAEPIWNTAERAGIKTAPDFWPGAEAPIHGMRPSRVTAFTPSMSANQRVDTLLGLLDGPEAQRPGFATLYFDQVDAEGHHFGPGSPELEAALAEVDAAIGHLVDGLKARGLYDQTNLIVVADHGMAELKPERLVIADDWISPSVARLVTTGSTGGFKPLSGHEAEAEAKLLAPHPGSTCWRKGEIPERFHYGKNPRVTPIVCLSELGGYFTDRKSLAGRPGLTDHGAHGYDPYAPEMRALFLAHGPAFKPGARLAPFDNVSVYPLLARLLGVRPEPGDGRLADTAPALKP